MALAVTNIKMEEYTKESMFDLTHVDRHQHVREDHTYDWLLRRINIAEQFVVGVDGGEKLTHDDVASKEEL